MADGGYDDQRGEHGQRSSDRELMQWRGSITERVSQNTKRMSELNGDLRDIRASVDALSREVVGLRSEVKEARQDIADSTTAIKEERHDELAGLRETISSGRLTRVQIWIFVVAAPIASALMVLIVTLATRK